MVVLSQHIDPIHLEGVGRDGEGEGGGECFNWEGQHGNAMLP